MSIDPQPITFQHHVFDFSFHPSRNLVAVGLINGQVECHEYSEETNTLAWTTQASKKSCRGVEFTNDGAHLMSISRDKSIQALDVATGRLLYKIPKAHKYAINKICKLDTNLTATGDDEGIVKIWDMRTCKATGEYKVHEDFVADMEYSQSNLLVAGGDGVMSIYDIRKANSTLQTTEELDDELLSMTVVKEGSTVIAGSQSGALYMWQWNAWDSVKKWIGHPSSVDALCNIDENAICTGASDGLLRYISISPQNFEGVLGDHGQDFPIECVKLNYSHDYLGSCGHDLQLRFWSIHDKDPDTHQKRQYEELDEPVMKRQKTREHFFDDL